MDASSQEQGHLALDEIDFREYWYTLVRRRKIVAFCLVAVVVTTLLYVLATKPVYRATTTLHIEPDSPNILSFEDAFQVDATTDAFYQTQYRLIESRSLARRVIDRQDLMDEPLLTDATPGFSSRLLGTATALPRLLIGGIRGLMGTGPPETAGQPQTDPRYTRAIDALLGRLEVQPIRNTRLARVSWSSTNPELAARVTNAIAQTYIDTNLEAKYETTEQASAFLATEIERLRQTIAEQEAELQRYGSERDILSLDERQDTVTQALTDLSAEYTRALTDRVQKQTYYEQLQETEPSSVPEVFTSSLVVRLKSDYAGMQQRYTEMSRRFTEDWPAMQQLRAQMEELEGRIASEEQRIFGGLVNSARGAYEAARDRESRISGLLGEQRDEAMQLNRNLATYRNLQVEIDSNKELLESLVERQSETGVTARLQGVRTSNIRVVDEAAVPLTAASPNLRKSLLLSALAGLVLGIGLALFQEYLDNTLNTPDQAEGRLQLPVLGLVPSLASVGDGSGRTYGFPYTVAYGDKQQIQEVDEKTPIELVADRHPRSALAESYRALRTSVLLSSAGKTPKVLLVSSSVPGEGKTTSAINLAVSLAQAGRKVLLIDADMRRPRLHTILDVDPDRGLVHYLTGNDDELRNLVQGSGIANLWALPCGPRPPNPAELLTSEQTATLIETVRRAFDSVVIDSPPLTTVVDALVLAPLTDGVSIVVRAGETPWPVVARARRRVQEVGGRVLGVVLNAVNLEAQRHYGYHHGVYRYGAEETADAGRKLAAAQASPAGRQRQRRRIDQNA